MQKPPGSAASFHRMVQLCQTGIDLFRPLVTLSAPDEATVGDLVHAALAHNRPYQIIVPLALASAVATR